MTACSSVHRILLLENYILQIRFFIKIGEFHHVYYELRNVHEMFFNNLRMSLESIDLLYLK